jgi:transposase InsO family protein
MIKKCSLAVIGKVSAPASRIQDNACAESFFHSLKVEAIHGEQFTTRNDMRRQVFEYVELDYNKQRRHSAIGMISPEAFEARMIA